MKDECMSCKIDEITDLNHEKKDKKILLLEKENTKLRTSIMDLVKYKHFYELTEKLAINLNICIENKKDE